MAAASPDPIQENLDAVNSKLTRLSFLKGLTPSRLPSQAASVASLSPGEAPRNAAEATARSPPGSHLYNQNHGHHHGHHGHHAHSSLNLVALSDAACVTAYNKDDAAAAGYFALRPDAAVFIELTAPLTQEFRPGEPVPPLNTTLCNELQSRLLGAYRGSFSTAKMGTERGFQTFPHGHQDLVLAVDFNYFGTRMVTASSDHKLKVWDKKDDVWTVTESWKAHDAEVTDVKWNGPFMGEVVGSIGEDGRCKIWQEDVTEMPNSGRRFKMITNLSSPTNAPFMSLDFKNIMQETWLALITRDGRLLVYEPSDPSNLNDWTVIAEHSVCGNNPPDRTEEVGFKVAFHKEKLPCWTAIMAGLDRKSLSLAVAAMRNVLVYRTDKARRFFLAAELKGASQIIRDVAWANGSMRGFDIIATASKDGAIRIYEISTPRTDKAASASGASYSGPENPVGSPLSGPARPSGIGAGLAGAARAAPEASQEPEQRPGRITQVAKLTDELTQHHGAVWRVAFSQMGDILISTGDDASIRTWKKAVNGHWAEYSEIDMVRTS